MNSAGDAFDEVVGLSDDEARAEREREKQRANGKPGSTGTAFDPRFKLKAFNDITMTKASSSLVTGIIPRVGLVVVWGPPKCGKSFWTFDLVMHIALGWGYRSRRVKQGPVVYFAVEGSYQFSNRVDAWRRRHLDGDDRSVPFYLLDVTIDLIADHGKLIIAIKAQLGETIPAAIVIDTLNRSLNGSENKPEDMAKYIRAADMIREAFGCVVIVIHHCGIEGSRPRGHSSLSGADDVQIAVERNTDGVITATVEHMKDGEPGAPIACRLERIELGENDDGEMITSCVILPVEGPAATQKRGRPLGEKYIGALDALKDCIGDMGRQPPASNHIPASVTKSVTLGDWREYCFKHNLLDREGSYREEFKRLHVTLKNRGFIGLWDDWIWTVT